MFKTNEYFEGKVKSIAFKIAEDAATIGVMAKGEYEFGTSAKEIMTVISGRLIVKLPNSEKWQVFEANQTFEIEANQKFQVNVEKDSAYLCIYKEEKSCCCCGC